MLRRYLRIREELIEASEDPEGDICIDTTVRFANKSERLKRMLSEIDVITKELQLSGHTLAACRAYLDLLISTIQEWTSDPFSDFSNFSLGTKYIGIDSDIVQAPNFESGIIKLQQSKEENFRAEEKESVAPLLKKAPNSSNVQDTISEEAPCLTMK